MVAATPTLSDGHHLRSGLREECTSSMSGQAAREPCPDRKSTSTQCPSPTSTVADSKTTDSRRRRGVSARGGVGGLSAGPK